MFWSDCMRKLDISVRRNYVQQAADWPSNRGLHCYKGNVKLWVIYSMVCWDGLPCSLVYTGCGETPCPNFVRWWGDQNKDLLSRNCMSEMCPCSPRDRQIGSDWGWKSSKTTEEFWKNVVFCTNLEQMFKRVATDLDTQLTAKQQRLTCALKKARLLLSQQ